MPRIPQFSRGQKFLVVLVVICLVVLSLLDLIVPSILAGVKHGLPKNIRSSIPTVEILLVVGSIAYMGGSYGLNRLYVARQREQYLRMGRTGRTREIIVPQANKAKAGEMADFFARLWDATRTATGGSPVSMEYVAEKGRIHCQIWTPEIEGKDLVQAVRTEVMSKYPESRVLPTEADLLAPLGTDDGLAVAVVSELQLSGPAHYPLKLVEEFKVDPLATLLNALGSAQTGVDLVVFQVVVVPANPMEWQPAMQADVAAIQARAAAPSPGLGSVLGTGGRQAPRGRPLTPEEKKKLALLQERVAVQQGFRVVVRIVAAGADQQACQQRVQEVVTAFGQFSGTAVGPQSFVVSRSYAFRPGTQKPKAPTAAAPAAAPAAPVDAQVLSESQARVLRQLQDLMGTPPPDAGGNGGQKVAEQPQTPAEETGPTEPVPVVEAQPLLFRLPAIVGKFWPPWGTQKPSIILTEGLAMVFHLPHEQLKVRGLVVQKARHMPPPFEPLISPVESKPQGWLIIALADEDREPPHWVGQPYTDLRRGGMYILGPAGTGKSVLLEFMGDQFIREARGLSVIDAKGDLARGLLRRVPLELEGVCAWVHPANRWRPVSVNFLDSRLAERIGWDQVQAGSMAVFQKMVGAQWETATNVRRILGNGTAAILQGEPRRQASLIKMYAFLQDDTEDRPNVYRAEVIRGVTDPVTTNFWTVEYPAMAKEFAKSSVAVRTRVEEFLRNPMARYMMGLPFSTVHFREIMDGRMILLASVPETLGEVQPFVGALIFNQIAAAGFSRYEDIPDEEQRVDHVVIVDEFQTFAAQGSQDMQTMLSKLRGARIAPVLAHQSTAQIDRQTMAIILANNETRVIFRLKTRDDAATVTAPWQPEVRPEDAMGLQAGRREVYMSCMVNGAPTEVFSARTRMAPKPEPEELGALPADGFRWSRDREVDEWVEMMAALEREMIRGIEQGDRQREAHYLHQGVALLKEMSDAQFAKYVERRRLRDAAEREYILQNPAVIPHKETRIMRLSSLRFGIPRAEAEYMVMRAMEQAQMMPTSGAIEAGVVEMSLAEGFEL